MQLQAVLEEALVNYQNNRFKDAEGAFRYLLQSAVQSNKSIDVVYFCYRLLELSRRGEKNNLDYVELWKNLGLYSLRIAKKELDQLPFSTEPREMEIREQIYRHLLERKEHERVIKSMLEYYSSELEDTPEIAISKLLDNPYLKNQVMGDKELIDRILNLEGSLEDISLDSKIKILKNQC